MPGIEASGFFVCRRGDAPSAFCRISAVNGRMDAYGVHSLFLPKRRRKEEKQQSLRMTPQEKEVSNDIRNI